MPSPNNRNRKTGTPRAPEPEKSIPHILRALFRRFLMRAGEMLRTFGLRVFYGRERILCGTTVAVLMILFALIQTTLFSTLRPFGAIPDMMISFVVATAISEGRKFGAVYGIVAAVIIESLGYSPVMLLPTLYMLIGFTVGVLCRLYITDSIVVRTLITLSVLPLRAIFTAIYTALSPISATAGEALLGIILPEAAATLLLAPPVHLIVYLCMRPFHRTRAEKVER